MIMKLHLNVMLAITFLLFCSSLIEAAAGPALQKYNVDTTSITVSGISSGAAMAGQYHFAHSNEIAGAGFVAGVPYCCGIGGLAAATTCMTTPALVNIPFLISEANILANSGLIDSTTGISEDKVYVFHGSEDSVVLPGSGRNVEEFYLHYGADVKTEFSVPAEHGFPTENFGAPCGSSSADHDYLNNCGFKGAFEMLNYLYGISLEEPQQSPDLKGDVNNLLEFDQAEFFTFHPSLSSMDTTGFVYVPTACQNGVQCKLHISFHGCMQSRGNVGNSYAANAGFMEVAEINNIIVLFPQVAATGVNLTACWDWFGYLNNLFGTKDGNQVLATYRMMSRITKG